MKLSKIKTRGLHNLFFVIISCLLIFIGILSFKLLEQASRLKQLENTRYKLYSLGVELKESSEDLTKFCRAYVLTGDGSFQQKYWNLLDSRKGIKPRPDGNTIALHDSLLKVGISKEEYKKLSLAEKNSNTLAWTENVAFHAMKGLFADSSNKFTIKGKPDVLFARNIVFNQKYYADKDKIMRPIAEFRSMLDKRISSSIKKQNVINKRLLIIIVLTIVITFFLSFYAILILRKRLIQQNEELDSKVEERSKELHLKYRELKKSQKALEQSEEKNRALIENISDTIILVNEKLEVIYQSPSFVRTAGFTLKDHKGKTVLDIIYPADVQQGLEIIEMAKASPGTAIPFQLRIFHKDGHHIWIEGTITNLFQAESVKAYVLNYRDITSRKLMESERLKIIDEILQRNRDLEQFAYIVSHNLRAPVANIIGLTNFLKEDDIEEDEKDKMTEGLNVSACALDSVIKDLNSILQMKREISEKKEMVRFSNLLHDVKLSIATLIDSEQVVINADFSEIDGMVTLKSYLHSIFYNLISNSIKYRQPEITPIIEIRSELSENKMELIFRDNGLGIDLEKRSDQVFGLYKRFHTHVDGKGMGLYMVKTQVETLGGKIAIKSEINKGTEFIIEFEKG